MDQISFSLPPGKVVTSGTLVVSNYVAAVPVNPFTETEGDLNYQSVSPQPYAASNAGIGGEWHRLHHGADEVCRHEFHDRVERSVQLVRYAGFIR